MNCHICNSYIQFPLKRNKRENNIFFSDTYEQTHMKYIQRDIQTKDIDKQTHRYKEREREAEAWRDEILILDTQGHKPKKRQSQDMNSNQLSHNSQALYRKPGYKN